MLRLPGFLLCLMAPYAMAGNPRLDFALGVLATSRQDQEEAHIRFEAARIADPTALPLVTRSVSWRIHNGDREGAVKIYRDLAAARPDELAIQLAYADFLDTNSGGDSLALKLSRETLERALAKNSGNPGIIRRLFLKAGASGDKGRQDELLKMLSSNDPASTLLFASLAKSSANPADLTIRAAVDQHFLDAMNTVPEDQELARAASDHFRETDRQEEAITILKQHVIANPSSLILRIRLGILLFAAKQDAEGESTLKQVLEIHPRMALAHQSLAKFYRLRKDPEQARVHSSELLKIRGGSANEFLTLGDEWLAADQPRQARLLLERAVFDYPQNGNLAAKLAIATRRDPDTRAKASRLFREAEAARSPDSKPDPTFLIESAETMIADGQSKAAEERLRNAIKAYPAEAKKETAAALRRLAQLWETENRNAEAAKSLRQRADGLER